MAIKIISKYLSLVFFISLIISSCENAEHKTITNAQFVGSTTCVDCHKIETNLWQGSDHDMAMDTAISTTVLGDFNNVEFERNGFTNRFYIKDGKYFVHTQGPQGTAGDFQIAYTFGYRPLQQYLVPFEDGRYQCLQIAWDTDRNQWYHLADSVYKGQEILPDNWLYWTNNAQNWNGMCAECHSTNLRKNYDPKTHIYNTTWSEIDIACEACHGPASEHNKWAEIDSNNRPKIANYGLIVQTSDISSRELVDQCAYCHARRSSFGDFVHPRKNLFDIISPQLPIEPFYFPDGQILEEDYVYSSFTQSKMHQNNVRCTNCHDAHSLKLKFDGNQLCYQCHKQEDYGNYNHHFHKEYNDEGADLKLANGEILKKGDGSSCIMCHMPGRYFMGVDYRRDHSMRIPRPDLSDKLGTPNACTQCHTDKSNIWAVEYTEKWYGKNELFHFGETMFLAANGDDKAVPMLLDLINSEASSPLVKASATHYLGVFPNDENRVINNKLLMADEALVRREAIRNFQAADLKEYEKLLLPLLDDSNRMIRIEAGSRLWPLLNSDIDSISKNKINIAIADYIETQEYSADFAAARHNLGNLYSNLGKNEKAIENYVEAIRIDNLFYPAKINLAMLYNRMSKNEEAERLLKEVIQNHPEMGSVYYSLGLLQAEMANYDKSIISLQEATKLNPLNSRALFNLFKLYEYKQEFSLAEETLLKCLNIESANIEFLYAQLEFLLKQKREKQAVDIAKKILELDPDTNDKQVLMEFINAYST